MAKYTREIDLDKECVVSAEEWQRDKRLIELYHSVLAWGAQDILVAAGWLDDADVDFGGFGEFVEDYCTSIGEVKMSDLDIAALALQFICSEAGVPEIGDYVYANYSCSSIDISAAKAGEVLNRVEIDDRNAAWRFVKAKTNAETTIECPCCDGSGERACPECDGDGTVPCECGGEDPNCPSCDGEGECPCERCEGTGVLSCRKCDGEGVVPESWVEEEDE